MQECAWLACDKCKDEHCPLEHSSRLHTWTSPNLHDRGKGYGKEWRNTTTTHSCKAYLSELKANFDSFHKHDAQVKWTKNQSAKLKAGLQPGEVIIKADFIESTVVSYIFSLY